MKERRTKKENKDDQEESLQVEWPLFGHWTFSPLRALSRSIPLPPPPLEMDIYIFAILYFFFQEHNIRFLIIS